MGDCFYYHHDTLWSKGMETAGPSGTTTLDGEEADDEADYSDEQDEGDDI